jgi:hypothetical protein
VHKKCSWWAEAAADTVQLTIFGMPDLQELSRKGYTACGLFFYMYIHVSGQLKLRNN